MTVDIIMVQALDFAILINFNKLIVNLVDLGSVKVHSHMAEDYKHRNKINGV